MAKKKKKGRQRPSTPPARSPFAVGAAVRVKRDVIDPDFPDVSLGGWAGRVAQVDRTSRPPLVRVTWDKATLEAQPPDYRERCENEDLDPETIWLEADDLEPDSGGDLVSAPPPQPTANETPLRIAPEDVHVLPPKAADTPAPAEAPATPAERVRAVFHLSADAPLPEINQANLKRYLRYLTDRITFPLAALYYEDDEPHPVILVQILSLPRKEEQREELFAAAIANEEEPLALPLCVVHLGDSEAGRLLDDYRYWLDRAPYRDAEGELIVPGPVGPRGALRAAVLSLLLASFYGAVAGATVGAALTALEWGRTFEAIGAGLVGIVGCLGMGNYEYSLRETNRKEPGMMLGGLFGAVGGAALGALLGALIVTFVGSILGAITGTLLGRIARWAKVPRVDEVNLGSVGACAGALVLLFLQDGGLARSGAIYGALIGALAAPLYMVGIVTGMFYALGRRVS